MTNTSPPRSDGHDDEDVLISGLPEISSFHRVNRAEETPKPHNQDMALEATLERCFFSNNGKGLFADKSNLAIVFADTYPFALELVNGGIQTCKKALENPCFQLVDRKPGNGKPFLIAMELGAKPRDEAARKTCSYYAKVLQAAYEEHVSVADFADWFSSTTITACNEALRKKRKAKKVSKDANLPDQPVGADGLDVGHALRLSVNLDDLLKKFPVLEAFTAALAGALAAVDKPSQATFVTVCAAVVREFDPTFQPDKEADRA